MAPENMRERILRAASELFGSRGYAATSTRMIADEVGVRQPSLFHHFPNKASIMDELLGHNLRRALAIATALSEGAGSPAERLYRYLRLDMENLLLSPYRLAGLDSEEVLGQDEFAQWREVQQALRGARRRMIEAGVEQGEFHPVDVDLGTGAITGLILGVIQGQEQLRQKDASVMAEQVADLALRALLRDPLRLDEVKARVDLVTTG